MEKLFYAIALPSISLIVSLWKGDNKFDRYFQLAMGVFILTEIIGIYVIDIYGRNFWVYNCHVPIVFVIYGLMYISVIQTKSSVRIIKFLIALLVALAFFLNVPATTFLEKYNIQVFLFGVVLILVFIFLYLRELLTNDKLLEYYRMRSFWISIGLIIFYVPILPVFVSMEKRLITPEVREIILYVLNILMHFSFLIAYIWSRRI